MDVEVRRRGDWRLATAAFSPARACAPCAPPQVQPLYNVMTDPVAPHGLLGQTYDGDRRPIHGKRDRYDYLDNGKPTAARKGVGGLVTTRANGEGAIEGHAEMYRVDHPFDTGGAFSRFGARSAAPRNITLMRG
jgi:hypothetical protein